jgi:hypothetical protein
MSLTALVLIRFSICLLDCIRKFPELRPFGTLALCEADFRKRKNRLSLALDGCNKLAELRRFLVLIDQTTKNWTRELRLSGYLCSRA